MSSTHNVDANPAPDAPWPPGVDYRWVDVPSSDRPAVQLRPGAAMTSGVYMSSVFLPHQCRFSMGCKNRCVAMEPLGARSLNKFCRTGKDGRCRWLN